MNRRPMQVDLTGRRAVGTGGGTGIGRAISLALARCGATVVVNYSRSADEAELTAAEIRKDGGQAVAARTYGLWSGLALFMSVSFGLPVPRFGENNRAQFSGQTPPRCRRRSCLDADSPVMRNSRCRG